MNESNVNPNKVSNKILYTTLLVIYLAALVATIIIGRSERVVRIFGNDVRLSSLAGVMSNCGNMCAILMATFLKKRGLITAAILMLVQLGILFIGFFAKKNLTTLSGLFTTILVAATIVTIYQRDKEIDQYRTAEMDVMKARQKTAELLFEQTATALVNAIEAKDVYSRGHSMRVAEYSRLIARQLGKSEEECNEIYYAGLLHDVGKIGISYPILTKKGRLTPQEYEQIKRHTNIGKQILSGISEYPYLSIAANSHHERYDGKGYPDKWKENDIPEIARIISVADAYDAMTSNRSYRAAMPQQLVREEIVKGAGTQFDPEIARAMQHLIDIDIEYEMKEREEVKELAGKNEMLCTEYRNEISEGVLIMPWITKFRLRSVPEENADSKRAIPTFILFDSLDGRVHDEEKTIKDLNYFEYAEIRLDGNVVITGARKASVETLREDTQAADHPERAGDAVYSAWSARFKDHVLIEIDDGRKRLRVTVALPDCARYAYIALTGEHCHLKDVSIEKTEEVLEGSAVRRIAPEISYIDGPEGDLPNVQIDYYRSAVTPGVPITDGLKIRFHTKSLPTARLIWHCPFISVFTSEDGRVNGKGFWEYGLVRLDGETWEDEDDGIINDLTVDRQPDFVGWDAWKENNKRGFDCEITFERKDNRVTLITENHGLFIRNTTYVDNGKRLFAALTGDQCVLTDIRIEGAAK